MLGHKVEESCFFVCWKKFVVQPNLSSKKSDRYTLIKIKKNPSWWCFIRSHILEYIYIEQAIINFTRVTMWNEENLVLHTEFAPGICNEIFYKIKHWWMNKWINKWANEWMNEWMNERARQRVNEWTNEPTNKLTNERASGRTDRRIYMYVYASYGIFFIKK